MKKIYFIVSLVVLALFTACQDYNANNFPGFNDGRLLNVASYTYSLTSADYTTIGQTFTKVYTDSVTSLKAQLTTAKTNKSADSTLIQINITRLTNKLATDSTLVAAATIDANKIFINLQQASKCIPIFLNIKYPYVDSNSSANVSYNLSYDTTTIAVANKYTFVMADYDAMGTTANLPGQYDNFSSIIDPNYFIPIYLKRTYPYAVKGDLKLIRYKYFISTAAGTPQIATLYLFDGTNWVNYNSASQVSKSFVYRAGKWLDLLIYKGLSNGLGDFTTQNIIGAQVWAWDKTYGAKISGYSGGNIENEDWLISPTIDLSNRLMATLSFNHTGKYFATSAGVVTKSTDATLWISQNYTSGLPSTATWTQITIPYWTVDFTFFPVKLSLNDYIGKKFNLAFKYISKVGTSGQSGTWEIKNFSITEE
jgi:hypothetical protein